MTAEEYIKKADSADDYLEKQAEDLEQKALEDIDALYNGEYRDVELWDETGVPDEITVGDYEEVETDDRDIEWIIGLAGISAASGLQFFLDNRNDLLTKPLAYKEQFLGDAVITKSELLKAGKRGFDVDGIASFAKIKKRYLDEFAWVNEMSSVDLYNTLVNNGAMRSIDKLIADSSGYVARMTNYKPGSTQFRAEVAKLISRDSTRGLKSMSRRAVQQIFTEREANGNPEQNMIWMVEGGKNTCGYCLDRAGLIKPYMVWIVEGLPGADVCAGGDLCNCFLAAI